MKPNTDPSQFNTLQRIHRTRKVKEVHYWYNSDTDKWVRESLSVLEYNRIKLSNKHINKENEKLREYIKRCGVDPDTIVKDIPFK